MNQKRPLRRQAHAALRADEELHAELRLEPSDLLAERRLRDVHAPRGAAEVELFGDGEEVSERS
jgi:hypothetical protein